MPSIDERAELLLEQARELAGRVTSAAELSHALFNPQNGIAAKAFPTLRERREFTMTKPYAEIYDILRGLMDKCGMVVGAAPTKLLPSGTDSAPPARWQWTEIEREQERTSGQERSA